MDSDNPKLAAFQSALNEALLRRLRDVDEQLVRLQKDNESKQKVRRDETQRLHQTQKLLKQEQRKLRQVELQLGQLTLDRQTVEQSNRLEEQRVVLLKQDLLAAKEKHDLLQRQHNQVLMRQIYLTARRVTVAGDVNANHTAASKAQHVFDKMQSDKSAQDMYLEKLAQDVEELEQKCLDHKTQAACMNEQTAQLERLIRDAEHEAEAVRHETRAIMQKWTSAVINVSKRDEALTNFREAVRSQELVLKGVMAEIEGARDEIVRLQERHGHLTAISRRTEMLCSQRRGQIKRTDELIEEAKQELHKASNAHLKTQERMSSTDRQIRAVSRDTIDATARIQKLRQLRRQLEDDLVVLAQDKNVSDKLCAHAGKQVHAIRERSKQLEERLADLQLHISNAVLGIATKTALISRQNEQTRQTESALREVQQHLQALDAGLAKARAEMDKQQSLIELKVKEKAAMAETHKQSGLQTPYEAEMQKLVSELQQLTAHCQQAKQEWLTYQNEYIMLLDSRCSMQASLTDLSRKDVIMQEKNNELQLHLKELQHTVQNEVSRKIDSLHGRIVRLRARLAEEKAHFAEAKRCAEGQRAEQVDKLKLLADQVEGAQQKARQLSQEVNGQRLLAQQSAQDLSEWEEKVRTCKRTAQLLHNERDPEGQVALLRSQVHRLQLRYEQVDKAIKVLSGALQNYVGRREGMVDKAAALTLVRKHRLAKTHMMKCLLSKRLDDLKSQLKKIGRKEKQLAQELRLVRQQEADLQLQFEQQQDAIQIRESDLAQLKTQIEHQAAARDRALSSLLRLQTRAKWYKAVQDKKYRLALRESDGKTDMDAIKAKNAQLLDIIRRFLEEFPALQRNIRRAEVALL